MPTVWIFGDSFADSNVYTLAWTHQVANNLNYDLKVLALGGTSLDYTYTKFNEYKEQINPGDVVVLALTDLSRYWFLKNEPNRTYWMIMERDPDMNKAIEQYLRYLENYNLKETYLENFLYNLHYFTKKQDIHTVILPSFNHIAQTLANFKVKVPSLNIASNSLLNVSLNEFEQGTIDPTDLIRNIVEFRSCHMMYSNHLILADKILDNIKKQTPIDLSQGFVSYALNTRTLNNDEFIDKEFFGLRPTLGIV